MQINFINVILGDDAHKIESTGESTGSEINEQLANTFEAIPNDIKLNTIVEKHGGEINATQFVFQKSAGFPKAKRRDVSELIIR